MTVSTVGTSAKSAAHDAKPTLAQHAFRYWKPTIVIAALTTSLLLFSMASPSVEHMYVPQPLNDLQSKARMNDVQIKNGLPNYFNEELAMKEPLCKDPKLAPDVNFSQIGLIGPQQLQYRLGDTISVSIRLYDSYNKSITRGGSIIRARMYNKTKQAFATAAVVDHSNGTYTASFEATWTGRSKIEVKIAYTPETIRNIYNARLTLPSLSGLDATFQVGKIKEKTRCHPTVEGLKFYNIHEYCNFTSDNSGMPWYCGKPKNIHLYCEDWVASKGHAPKPGMPLTKCEAMQMKRVQTNIVHTVSVNVGSGKTSKSLDHVPYPTLPCFSYNRTMLWNRKRPTGFMYRQTWHLSHCRGITREKTLKCLENWKVVFIGDSTIRYWFRYIFKDWNCKLITEKWTYAAWKRRSVCRNADNNFTAEWRPHAQPFHGVPDNNRYTRASISRHLDEMGNDERVIVVITMYAHLASYHHSVFRTRIQRIRRSVESLLERNKFVKIMIKAPHTHHSSYTFYADIYSNILYEEFAGLYDRVTYLDQKDITIATDNEPVHPNNIVVGAMVNQTLAYACE